MPSTLTSPSVVAVFAFALILGAIVAWILARARARAELAAVRAEADDRARELGTLKASLVAAEERLRDVTAAERQAAMEAVALTSTLTAEREAGTAKAQLLELAEQRLREAFEAISAQALRANNEQFLTLAKTSLEAYQEQAKSDLEQRQQQIGALVAPVAEGLTKMTDSLTAFDKSQAENAATVQQNLRTVAESHLLLQKETNALVNALRAPQTRGQWGELALRRVVEFAGMTEHCDFVEQDSVTTQDGRLRPDLKVHLPGRKLIIVDAKAPLKAYLEAMEATDESARTARLVQHARQVREHVTQLSGKEYASQFPEAPDFVVLFLPGETFFSEACRHDPDLIEFAVRRGVIPASPTTLITVLKAVSYGWQQARIAEQAEAIGQHGRELYERMTTLSGHLDRVGRGLTSAVQSFNSAMGSLEKRVWPTARKFKDLGVGTEGEFETPEVVEQLPRTTVVPELRSGAPLP